MPSASLPSTLSRMNSARLVCTGYTFCMKGMVWFIVLAAVAGIVYGLYRMRAKWEERNRASEERFASFMKQALPAGALAGSATPAAPGTAAAPAVPPMIAEAKASSEVAIQRMLLEAASKAGEAGEPALSIQLYAKLLARYPACTFVQQARAAVETQKKKLAPPKPS